MSKDQAKCDFSCHEKHLTFCVSLYFYITASVSLCPSNLLQNIDSTVKEGDVILLHLGNQVFKKQKLEKQKQQIYHPA